MKSYRVIQVSLMPPGPVAIWGRDPAHKAAAETMVKLLQSGTHTPSNWGWRHPDNINHAHIGLWGVLEIEGPEFNEYGEVSP